MRFSEESTAQDILSAVYQGVAYRSSLPKEKPWEVPDFLGLLSDELTVCLPYIANDKWVKKSIGEIESELNRSTLENQVQTIKRYSDAYVKHLERVSKFGAYYHPGQVKETPEQVLSKYVAKRVLTGSSIKWKDLEPMLLEYFEFILAEKKRLSGDEVFGEIAMNLRYGAELLQIGFQLWDELSKTLFKGVYVYQYLLGYCKDRETSILEMYGMLVASKPGRLEVDGKGLREVENDDELLQEDCEYKNAPQHLAWLHELGILKLIVDRCTPPDGNLPNWSKAAKIIGSITGLHPKNNVLKPLRAIFLDKDSNNPEHPLHARKNQDFITDMKRKYRLDED